MNIARHVWLAVAMVLGLVGCRAAGTGSLSLHPRPLTSQASLDLDRFIDEHNRNAQRVESLQASPSITGRANVTLFHADGRMAMERPRNFKLEMLAPGSRALKADMGSNDREFWFWVQNREDKSIYWCNHSDLASTTLAVTYQPDWIIEALGLKPISPEEADQIRVKSTPGSATTTLVFPARQSNGETYRRVLIVSNADRRIKETQIYAGQPQILVARAEVRGYQEASVGPADSASRETCFLPEELVLEWKREELTLSVALRSVRVNQFDSSLSVELFDEPKMPGYTRRNLAELSRNPRDDQRSTVRQTLPQPGPRNGVRLGRPIPVPDDETAALSRARGGAVPRRPALNSTEAPVEVVGAPFPEPPAPRTAQAASMMAGTSDTYLGER
jgi:hypothetical protein